MKFVIDRFEGEYAICEKESGELLKMERSKFPSEASEGDVITIDKNIITIDRNETQKRKEKIEKLMDELWE